MKAIIHGKTVLTDRVIEDGVILCDGGVITAVGAFGDIAIPGDAEVIDAQGKVVGPGFVDIHCHAGGKFKFESEPAEAARYHLEHGSTSMCGTLGYNLTVEETLAGMDGIRAAMNSGKADNLVGIHMEGPYISPNHGTNHTKAKPITREECELYWDRAGDLIRQWMYAPELPNADMFEDFCKSHDLVTAVGHTDASYDDLRRAADAGATIVTHMYDAMGCWRGNDSIAETGVIQESVPECALLVDEFSYEVIPDSCAIHVKPVNMRTLYKFAGADRVVLVTDSFYRDYDPADYPRENKRSVPDLNFNIYGELYGSTLTMNYSFKNYRHFTGANLVDMFKMASLNAARLIRIADKAGSIEVGKLANFVMLDENDDLQGVILKGELVK